MDYPASEVSLCDHCLPRPSHDARLGDDIIFHLLVETSIFLALPNACYCQLTGKPIVDLPAPPLVSEDLPNVMLPKDTTRKRRGRTDRSAPAKRPKLAYTGLQPDPSKATRVPASAEDSRQVLPCAIIFFHLLTSWQGIARPRRSRFRGHGCSTSILLGEIPRRKLRRYCRPRVSCSLDLAVSHVSEPQMS